MTDVQDAEHSVLGASGAERWINCWGSVALGETQPNEGSSYADEGTAAHALAALLLGGSPKELDGWERGNPATADEYIGREITVSSGRSFEITEDFAEHVQRYVDYVRSITGDEDILLVETRVNYARYLGVPKDTAWGTSDAIVIHTRKPMIHVDDYGWLVETGLQPVDGPVLSGRLAATVADLKFGAGVAVSAVNNSQGKLYGVGALDEIELVVELEPEDLIRIVISQPRIGDGEPSEWYITVKALRAWARGEVATAAQHALKIKGRAEGFVNDPFNLMDDPVQAAIEAAGKDLTPGDKQCRWCNAKAVCPAVAQHVYNTVANEFVDLDAPEHGTVPKTLAAKIDVPALTNEALAEKMRTLDLIEKWISAVRSATEIKLLQGETIPGYKLVKGKKGSRHWVDTEAAIKTLKRVLGVKDALKPAEPISPTAVEAFMKKDVITKRQWASLQSNIGQSEGGLSVAPESDKRPAHIVTPVGEGFENVEGEADDLSHLL